MNCFGQNSSYFVGFLYRYSDNKPIENAHILVYASNNVSVFISDIKGKFKIPLNLLETGHPIEVTALGFEKLIISNFLQHTFKLKEQANYLDEVVLESSGVEKNLNNKMSWSKTLKTFEQGTMWNGLLAVYIPYEDLETNKEIRLLKYRVTDFKWTKGLEYLPFEATLFEVNKETKLPGTQIIPNLTIKKLKGQRWATVDVYKFGISIPKEGLFIVMKILSKEYYNEQYISTAIGAIEAAPAIRFYTFDPNYIRKSYLHLPISEEEPNNSPLNGWQLFKGHFLIDYEF